MKEFHDVDPKHSSGRMSKCESMERNFFPSSIHYTLSGLNLDGVFQKRRCAAYSLIWTSCELVGCPSLPKKLLVDIVHPQACRVWHPAPQDPRRSHPPTPPPLPLLPPLLSRCSARLGQQPGCQLQERYYVIGVELCLLRGFLWITLIPLVIAKSKRLAVTTDARIETRND